MSMAKAEGLATFGMELNPEGVRLARAAGHEVYDCLASELLRDPNSRRFSLVTAWQVLEHVPDPVEFLRDCALLARPGGFVGVAVPNEDGGHRLCPYDPHLWPPHHISRWRGRDLAAAGAKAGLRLVKSGSDVLSGSMAKHFWLLHNKLAPGLGFKPHPGGELLPSILWLLYRKSGARHFLPRRGPSVYAFFTRPA